MGASQKPKPSSSFRAEIAAVDGVAGVRLADGRRVRLQGISLPAQAVRPDGAEQRLRTFLEKRLVGRKLDVFPEDSNAPGEAADLTAVLRSPGATASINEEALAAGLAVLSCRTPDVRELDRLRAAAAAAQDAGAGWFARPAKRLAEVPYLNGAVLGLHALDPRERYFARLDELADAGFRHVSLLISAFVENATAVRIQRDRPRCVRDDRLIETIRYAKQKGMSVMLLPIVLLIDAGEDDWRGTLRPSDPGAFWLAYDRFLSHYVDIAEATDADFVSIGSELGSLEHHTEIWRRLIANARGRYRGMLAYSANWDHVHVPRFFGQLDVVGMTAYFSLTEKNDPSLDELEAGWRKIGTDLSRSVGMLGKPVIFTELGYASQDGINRDPWNYLMNKGEIDLDEQAQCFEAFLRVVRSMKFLRGAYFYDYFDAGGPEDHSYSPRGKPAFEQWKRWARYRE